jgi:eukaryotic-like serine/threonine-protein kinase
MATQPDWEAVKALFEAALEVDPAKRSSFLKERCPDLNLRSEVERLLAEHDQAGAFLSTPVLANVPRDAEGPGSRLSAGEVLAGRFCIVRFIASGGMGEVYEAEDQELRDRVAVKIIRPEILREPNAVTRFKREVYLARKVTHPNVCRIFDLFRHKPEGRSSQEEIVFISMELLNGKTLGTRLKESGRMATEEALPLVRQMASALAAAHEAGIVHRDFKPGNVVLVGASDHWRAVVTDFGLALRSVTSDETASFPSRQGLLGTPAYMSPEQLQGRPPTPASDIYALGLVMYEMVTGARPFQGDTPISAALKRLTENPAPPRRLQPGVSGVWESVILRCLQRDPARRFTSAKDITEALACDVSIPTASRAGLRKLFAVVVALALLALLWTAMIRYETYRRRSATEAHSDVIARRSVAILGFKNLSERSDLNWISTALSEELTDELSAGQQLRIVPGETVARLKADLSLTQTDSLASQPLSKVRNALGTDIVVTGSYLQVADRLRVDVQLKNAMSGDTITTLSDTANEDQMLDLVSRIGGTLREKVGVLRLTSSQEQAVKTAQAANPTAARFYAEGLEKLRSFDALGARSLFESAIEADGGYALAHSALASTWLQLGYDGKAKEEAAKAVELGNGLNREDRLWIEAQFHEAAHEETQAVQSLQSLFYLAPDNPEYGLRLVTAQLANGSPSDAANALATLRKLPLASNDARIDLAEANIARSLGDHNKCLAAASLAQEKAESAGARILTGLALMRQSSALDTLGRQDEALARGERARHIFSEAGDRDDFAKMNSNLAGLLVRQGKFEEAKRRYQESLDEFDAIGDKRGQEVIYDQLAWVAESRDDLDGAQKLYDRSLAMERVLDDKPRIGWTIGSIALILSYKGDLPGAISKTEEVLAISKETGQADLESRTRIDLAGMFLARGDIASARELLIGADELLAKAPNSRSKAQAAKAWGDILTIQGRLAEARQKYQDALKTAIQSNEKQLTPYCQLSLAELEIEQHRTAEAELILKEVIEYFHTQKNNGGEAWALGDYVRADLESGNLNTALENAKRAKILAQHDRSLSGLDVHWSVALAEGLTGNIQPAQEELKDLAREAKKQGNVDLAFKVRLALGEIALKSHDNSGRKMLADLSQDAAAKGFLLVAQKARDEAATGPDHP